MSESEKVFVCTLAQSGYCAVYFEGPRVIDR